MLKIFLEKAGGITYLCYNACQHQEQRCVIVQLRFEWYSVKHRGGGKEMLPLVLLIFRDKRTIILLSVSLKGVFWK